MSATRGVSGRTVRLVAHKELLEALRDRRTLFVALVLPVLLYPLVMLGVAPLISMQKQRLQRQAQAIVVTGPGRASLVEMLDQTGETGTQDPGEGPGLRVVESPDPASEIRSGSLALWVEVGEGFATAIESEGTGELTIHWDASEDSSRVAQRKFEKSLAAAEARLLDARLSARGLDVAFRDPIRVSEWVDVATPERRGAYTLGKLLALILVVMTLSGSFYPAVDSVAGEKERGTMETLLVAPCGRAELVLGKFLAVLVVTLVAAALNLASMGLTMGPLMSGLEIPGLEGLRVTPTVLGGILCLLIPLSALFSAVSLALSTLARSVKEAQHYLTPLFLVVMPLAMVVVIPDVPLSPTLAAVPVTNVVLFFRDLMLERTEWGTMLIVLLSTGASAALALWAVVLLFLREETLFRGPEGTGPLLSRPLPRPVPGPAAAAFLFAAALSGIWYAQPILPADDLPLSIVVSQFGLILAPCLLLAWWLRVRPRSTFALRSSSWGPLLLAAPLGAAAPAVNTALHRALHGEVTPEGPFRYLAEQFERLVGEQPAWSLILLLAFLPAIAEEVFFRGFVLSAMRGESPSKGRTTRAVLVSAAFFAVFHIYPEKWLATGLVGLLLGYLVVRSGSILPAIVAHAFNNGAPVLDAKLGDLSPFGALYRPDAAGHAIAVAAAAATLVGGVGVLVWTSRPTAASAALPELDGSRGGE